MPYRVLLVEDNPQSRYLATYLLEHSGYEVLTAENGAEALDKASTEQPDLILMDIQLPEMDGYEATTRLKSLPATRHIPIVAVTSYAMLGDRERALALGCVAYIEKPFRPQVFLDAVKRHIGVER